MISPTLEGRSVSVTHQVPTRSPRRRAGPFRFEGGARKTSVSGAELIQQLCEGWLRRMRASWPAAAVQPRKDSRSVSGHVAGDVSASVVAGWEERPPPINSRISRTTPSSGSAGRSPQSGEQSLMRQWSWLLERARRGGRRRNACLRSGCARRSSPACRPALWLQRPRWSSASCGRASVPRVRRSGE